MANLSHASMKEARMREGKNGKPQLPDPLSVVCYDGIESGQ